MTEWELTGSGEHAGRTEEVEAATDVNERITQLVAVAREFTGDEMTIHGGYGNARGEGSVPMVVVQLGERKFPFDTMQARALVAALLSLMPVVSDDKELTALLRALVLGVYEASKQIEAAARGRLQ